MMEKEGEEILSNYLLLLILETPPKITQSKINFE
jgi:hypothetical protein